MGAKKSGRGPEQATNQRAFVIDRASVVSQVGTIPVGQRLGMLGLAFLGQS